MPIIIYIKKYSSNFLDKILHGFFSYIIEVRKKSNFQVCILWQPIRSKTTANMKIWTGVTYRSRQVISLYRPICSVMYHSLRLDIALTLHVCIHVANPAGNLIQAFQLTTDPPVFFKSIIVYLSIYIQLKLIHDIWKKGFLNTYSGHLTATGKRAFSHHCDVLFYQNNFYHRQVIQELVWSEITILTGPDHHPLFGPTVEILFKLN